MLSTYARCALPIQAPMDFPPIGGNDVLQFGGP